MRYFCNNCNSYNHQKKCEFCGSSTTSLIKIAYCQHCQMPVEQTFNYRCKICDEDIKIWVNDIIPVFHEEKLVLSTLLNQDITNMTVWNIGSNHFIIGNKRIVLPIPKGHISEALRNNVEKLIKKTDWDVVDNTETETYRRFTEANNQNYKFIEYDAHKFITETIEQNNNRMAFISFSGGKDSSVVSDLVRQAIGRNDVLHIFGNTTLEVPLTYEFINKFKIDNLNIPFFEACSEKDFFSLCETIGPPTRIRSWCCSIFKSGPISQLLNSISYSQDGIHNNFLTFYGIRGSESTERSKYGKISMSPKITSQKVVSPIFDWRDFDVWLYILTRKISFNKCYRLGFRRVGCWCCPNNSRWSELLNEIYFKNQNDKWMDFLYSFSQRIGKEDYKTYVDDGRWKARYGGAGLDNSQTKVLSAPCIDNMREHFILNTAYDDSFDELMKPFGYIEKKFDGDQIVLTIYKKNAKKPLFLLETSYGSQVITFLPIIEKNRMLLRQRIECQIRKYQICIKCSACDSICRQGAISTKNSIYKIDENKCINCMDCVATRYLGGCLINESLQQKEA